MLFIMYGSLIPFDYSGDPSDVSARWERAWSYWPFDPYGVVGRIDIITNVLLYIPLGLLVATRLRLTAWCRFPVFTFVLAVAVGSALSAVMEIGQLYSRVIRVSSAQDWLSNTVGTAIGALMGAAFGRIAWIRLRRTVRQHIRVRPMLLACAVMVILLIGDAFFPLKPTLDIGDVKQNIRQTLNHLDAPLAEHTWDYYLVNKVMVFAALAAALAGGSRREGSARFVRGALLAMAIAAATELGKTFIETRYTSPGNLLMTSLGAISGGLLAAWLAPKLTVRTKAWIGVALIATYALYQLLTPRANMHGKAAPLGSEVFRLDESLLPLYHYVMRGGLEDVRLFVYNVLLTGGITFTLGLAGVWARTSRRARMAYGALLTGLVGVGVEGLQFFIPGRVPSTTDVFCYALGGALGGWAYHRMHQRAYLGRPAAPDEIPEALEIT